DAILSYEDGPLEVAVGQHNNFQSLEELTSSLHTTFIERAAFT
ncbi:MAG TPA: porin, partial [Erythrobacter sp.]|nr:porin [Erythrobacter sp.]